MGVLAAFAILVLFVASSFAIEEYSEPVQGDSFKSGRYSGRQAFRGADAASASVHVGKAAPAHQAFARSVTEEGEAFTMDADNGQAGMANSGGTTLGSDLLAMMEQNLDAGKGDDANVAKTKRMLVHSGNISLMSPRGKVNEIADKISNLISKDGYVEERSESLSYTHWSGKKDRKTIRMQMRVPSANFHEILDQIQTMVDKDHVLSVSSQSRDVTDEYIDANARADTLSASRDALKTILTRANSVKDVLAVKNELSTMTEQIESHRRMAVYLQKQAVSCYNEIYFLLCSKKQCRDVLYVPNLLKYTSLFFFGHRR